MEGPLRNIQEILQGPCVKVTQEEWDSSSEKLNGKLWKNMCQSTQHDDENGSSMTQKERTKRSVHLETMEKHYRDPVEQHTIVGQFH